MTKAELLEKLAETEALLSRVHSEATNNWARMKDLSVAAAELANLADCPCPGGPGDQERFRVWHAALLEALEACREFWADDES